MADGEHTVRLLDDGPSAWRNAEGYTATQDQPVITGLSSDAADYLTSDHPFEEVIDVDGSVQADVAADAADESAHSDADANAAEDTTAADTDADVVGDGGDFDVDAFHEQGYQKRADQVESGAVDEHLDEIYAAETSETVKEAIEARDAFDSGG